MKTNKEKLQKLKDEFLTYFDADFEYGRGYLDCLVEVCKALKIPATRTENDVIIERNKK